MSTRIVVDHRHASEGHWRKQWEEAWKLAADNGWTANWGDDTDPVIVLRPDADCLKQMGRGKHAFNVNIRHIIETLTYVGAMRGWYTTDDPRYVPISHLLIPEPPKAAA